MQARCQPDSLLEAKLRLACLHNLQSPQSFLLIQRCITFYFQVPTQLYLPVAVPTLLLSEGTRQGTTATTNSLAGLAEKCSSSATLR
jgi:hypothetical protein